MLCVKTGLVSLIRFRCHRLRLNRKLSAGKTEDTFSRFKCKFLLQLNSRRYIIFFIHSVRVFSIHEWLQRIIRQDTKMC